MTVVFGRTGVATMVLCLGFTPMRCLACAACGCTINSDAAIGYSDVPGMRANLEYTYIDQNQLRIGTHATSPAAVVNNPSDPSSRGGEIERNTTNQYITLGLSYRPTAEWNVNLLIPYVIRDHTTYGAQQQPYSSAETAPGQISSAKVSSLGDMKLIGSYQGLLADHSLGLQLGIKLPTGHYGTAVNFAAGPNAGTPLDASLQAGTGSTDVIVGAYYHQSVKENFDVFSNAQFQTAVAHKQDGVADDFIPGNSETLNVGVRYQANASWIPQLQLNVMHRSPDRGALADHADTVGTVAYVSPGVAIQVVSNLSAYTVVQVPIYSKLDGYQLFPHYTATVGLSYAF